MRERGQRPSRPDRRRRGGQRAREQLPPHHAHQRRRDHASGRRNGGEAGGDGAGRAALGRESQPPLPCHQRRTAHRAASAARPTQTEATSTGRRPGARPPGAAARRARNKLPCPAPRAAQGRADGQPGKPPGAKRTGATARRGQFWPPVRLCGGFFRWWWIVLPFQRKKRKKGRKNANFRVDMCRTWLYTGYGRVEHARKECRTWKTRNENGQFRPSTHGVLARGCPMTYSSG